MNYVGENQFLLQERRAHQVCAIDDARSNLFFFFWFLNEPLYSVFTESPKEYREVVV